MVGLAKVGFNFCVGCSRMYTGHSGADGHGARGGPRLGGMSLASAVLRSLGIGRITFLGDYLWVQRDADGVLLDVWMRAPDDAGDGELGEK